MEIHPVKIEADYDAALVEIERLWGAPEGSPDGDRLDVLLVLIENYESKHHAIDPPDPIAAIKFRNTPLTKLQRGPAYPRLTLP